MKNWYWVHTAYWAVMRWPMQLIQGTGNWIWDIVHYRLKSGGFYARQGRTLKGDSWWYYVRQRNDE